MIRAALALGLALLAFGPAAHAAAPPIELEVGESRTLGDFGAISQVVVSVADVVTTAAPNAREIKVTGAKPGSTMLTLVSGKRRSSYEIAVVETGARKAAELRRRLQNYPGAQDVTVEMRDGVYAIGGSVPDLDTRTRVVTLAQGLADGKITDLVEISGRQVVAVDVRFVAVSDTTLKALGFNFSKLGQGFEWALFSPDTLDSFSTTSAGLNIQASAPLQNAFNLLLHDRSQGVLGVLSTLSDAGLSQVLAQPTLMVRSGEQAEFLAGGEIPIPVPQGGSGNGAITIEYRQYGVRLAIEPYVASDKRIVLKLAPEVSELDYANRVSIQGFSIPGFRRRSANTTVELGDGQSFVIAGLTYATANSNESKLPGLGELPILGSLFKAAQRSREKLELVIVATPRLVSPMDAKTADALVPRDPPRAPAFTDVLLNRNSAGSGADRFGLSR